ncbi:MAG: carbamate kinase [Parachlamydiales bacterium]|jgi:carbamate kinase
MGKKARKKVLLALGGNALLRANEKGTDLEQLGHIRETCKYFLKLLEKGYDLAITHGNGPQVGAILLQNEMAKAKLPSMPLDLCGAKSQGFIGYMLARELFNALKQAGCKKEAVCLVTQVLVDPKDRAFQNPAKPIGPFYSELEAKKLEVEKGWQLVLQTGKGFRRVVPSPEPIGIVEAKTIKELFLKGRIVIACGGGGIPVVQKADGSLVGVEAVIDKDHTAAFLAQEIGADLLVILTDVEQVAINFGKNNQQNLNRLSVEEAEKYLLSGEFGKGSMGPKVEAARHFVLKGGSAMITSLEKCLEALEGKTGTLIYK